MEIYQKGERGKRKTGRGNKTGDMENAFVSLLEGISREMRKKKGKRTNNEEIPKRLNR